MMVKSIDELKGMIEDDTLSELTQDELDATRSHYKEQLNGAYGGIYNGSPIDPVLIEIIYPAIVVESKRRYIGLNDIDNV